MDTRDDIGLWGCLIIATIYAAHGVWIGNTLFTLGALLYLKPALKDVWDALREACKHTHSKNDYTE